MKHLIFIISLIVFCNMISCTKPDTPDINLPVSVELGQSQFYINGELKDYDHLFIYDTINKQMGFVFRHDDISKNSKTQLSFSFLPYSEGKYILHRERILYKGAFTGFNQLIAEDLKGWSFELDRPEDGYFEIIKIDKLNKTVLIKFKAMFKVSSKNGNGDTGLPENIKFEGIFNESYQEG